MSDVQDMDVSKQEDSLVCVPYNTQVIADFLIHSVSQYRLGILFHKVA